MTYSSLNRPAAFGLVDVVLALISSLSSPQRFLAILGQAEAGWVLFSVVSPLYAQALRRRRHVRMATALSTAALG